MHKQEIDELKATVAAIPQDEWVQGTRGPNGCPIIGNDQGGMLLMLAHSTLHADQKGVAEVLAAYLIAFQPKKMRELLLRLEELEKFFSNQAEDHIFGAAPRSDKKGSS